MGLKIYPADPYITEPKGPMKLRHLLAFIVWSWAIPGLAADSLPLQPSSSTAQQSLKDGLEAYRLGQFRRAYALLEPLAGGGEAQAQFTLAMMYSSGNGIELDEYQAAHWFTLAATQGHRDAAYFLARLYEQGWGTSLSQDQAIYWYQRCAEQADPRCQMRLAQRSGEGQTPAKVPVVATEQTTLHAPPLPPPPSPATAAKEPSPAKGLAAESTTPSLPSPHPPVATGAGTVEPTSPPPVATVEPVTEPTPALKTAVPPPSSPAVEPIVAPTPTTTAELLGEDWVRTQKPTYYTLQILTSPLEKDIRTFVRRHDLKGELAMVSELRQGRMWYNLIYGSYKNTATANKARAALPPEVLKSGAWWRRFRDLHSTPTQDKPVQ
ncbi:conserved hypothetical protein [Gammaproteobacteria bacterium]